MNTLVLSHGDPGYPPSLLELCDPPRELHVRGALRAGLAVALVGTRSASPAGHAFAERLSADLARLGISVVSGGARGIDGASHEGALAAGGHTVAVVATGVDVAYPSEHEALFERIARSGGAVISERPLGAEPLPGAFPARNRIIAALSACTVVVEAPARSGALSTARAALRLGRPVLAMPGRPDDPRVAGCLMLLRAGARVCAGAADVLEVLAQSRARRAAPGDPQTSLDVAAPRGPSVVSRARPRTPLVACRPRKAASLAAIPSQHAALSPVDRDERTVLSLLGNRPVAFDELCTRAGLSAARVRAALGMLGLAGLVAEKPGDAFERRRG